MAYRKAKWDSDKTKVDNISKLKEELENVNNQIAQAKREYNLEKSSRAFSMAGCHR